MLNRFEETFHTTDKNPYYEDHQNVENESCKVVLKFESHGETVEVEIDENIEHPTLFIGGCF